jgi:hypothetical protein
MNKIEMLCSMTKTAKERLKKEKLKKQENFYQSILFRKILENFEVQAVYDAIAGKNCTAIYLASYEELDLEDLIYAMNKEGYVLFYLGDGTIKFGWLQ